MRQLCGRVLLIFSLIFNRTPLIVGRLSSWMAWRIFCTFSSVLVKDRQPETSKTKPKIGQFVGFCWTHGFIMDTLLKHFINNRSWFLWLNIKLAAKSTISLVYEDHSTHPAQTHLTRYLQKHAKFLRDIHYCDIKGMKSAVPIDTQSLYGWLAPHAPVRKLMSHISCTKFYPNQNTNA